MFPTYRGQYKIVGKNAKTGEEYIKRDWTDNIITAQAYDSVIGNTGVPAVLTWPNFGVYLADTSGSLAGDNFNIQNSDIALADVFPASDRSATTPVSTDEVADPPFAQFTVQYANPGAARQFDTVFVGSVQLTGGNTVNFAIRDILAYNVLNPACPQATNEIVILFYRIFFFPGSLPANSVNFINPPDPLDLFRLFVGSPGVDGRPATSQIATYLWRQSVYGWWTVPSNASLPGYERIRNGNAPQEATSGDSFGDGLNDSQTDTSDLVFDTTNKKLKATLVIDQDLFDSAQSFNGRILCNIAQGSYQEKGNGTNGNLYAAIGNLIYSRTGAPVQNVIGHDEMAPGPLFNEATTSTGFGSIEIQPSSGGWTKQVPSIYAIVITSSGSSTTAQYRLRKKVTVGWDDSNSWGAELISNNPWRFPSATGAASSETNAPVPFSDRQVITYTQVPAKLSITNVVDGSFTNYDSTTTPAYPYAAQQIDANNGLIYIADPGQGLFVLDVSGGTITGPADGETACYGVEVSNNGTVYWISPTGLKKGTGNLATGNTTTTFAFPGTISSSDVQFIKVNKAAGKDNEVAVLIRDPDNSNQETCLWWNDSTNVTTKTNALTTATGTDQSVSSSYRWLTTSSFIPSQAGNAWFFLTDQDGSTAGRPQWTTFESLTGNRLSNVNNKESPIRSQSGNVNYAGICLVSWNDLVLTEQGLFPANNSSSSATFTFNGASENTLGGPGCVLPDGLLVTRDSISPINNGNGFTDQDGFWIEYGWNGSEFVEGNTSSRTASSSFVTLLDGLEIRFTDGVAGTQFVATDYYTVVVCDGIFKDNQSDFPIVWSTYYYPVVEAADPIFTISSTTYNLLAASSGKFIRIDTDTDTLLRTHIFEIDGSPVTAILTSGTPAAGQITLNSDGTVTLAAADNGKTFEAKRYVAILEAPDATIAKATIGQRSDNGTITFA